jgi:hypothetical protein
MAAKITFLEIERKYDLLEEKEQLKGELVRICE